MIERTIGHGNHTLRIIRDSYLEPVNATRDLIARGNSSTITVLKVSSYFLFLSPASWLIGLSIVRGDGVGVAIGVTAFGMHGFICRDMRMK